ncbi:hypothetical protein B0H19DRAFT_1345608 [Mycena capillaripes]|nr:hypothetical protein B0H19DRAFT_1345608 [Mycena capillaripes]
MFQCFWALILGGGEALISSASTVCSDVKSNFMKERLGLKEKNEWMPAKNNNVHAPRAPKHLSWKMLRAFGCNYSGKTAAERDDNTSVREEARQIKVASKMEGTRRGIAVTGISIAQRSCGRPALAKGDEGRRRTRGALLLSCAVKRRFRRECQHVPMTMGEERKGGDGPACPPFDAVGERAGSKDRWWRAVNDADVYQGAAGDAGGADGCDCGDRGARGRGVEQYPRRFGTEWRVESGEDDVAQWWRDYAVGDCAPNLVGFREAECEGLSSHSLPYSPIPSGMASSSTLIPWSQPDAKKAVAEIDENSRPEGGGWGLVLHALLNPSPGRTLDEIYRSLGKAAEKQANRVAYKFGLGPHIVANKIKASFGEGEERVQQLELLRNSVPPKLEKRCSKLMKYTQPTESGSTQCQAFKEIVDLITLFPGLRVHFLCAKCLDGATSTDGISALWNRPTGSPDTDWTFWQSFAATCLCDTDISAMLEGSTVLDLLKCTEGTLSMIEMLLVEHDSSTLPAQKEARGMGGKPEFRMEDRKLRAT